MRIIVIPLGNIFFQRLQITGDPFLLVFQETSSGPNLHRGREKDLKLYQTVEELAPEIIAKYRRIYKGVSPNVDFYSGFVYSMLDIPLELYTPMFAIARIVGWSAHRLEELINVDKIIRPAYKSVADDQAYVDIRDR